MAVNDHIDQTAGIWRDVFHLGPAQVTDQPGSFCETTLTDHMTKLLLKLSRDYFYLGPTQVTDQPGGGREMAGRLERLEAGVRQLEGGDHGLQLRLEAGGHQHVGRHVILPAAAAAAGGVVVVIGQASYQVPSGCCRVAAGVHRSHF
jgi:hypothetical protein